MVKVSVRILSTVGLAIGFPSWSVKSAVIKYAKRLASVCVFPLPAPAETIVFCKERMTRSWSASGALSNTEQKSWYVIFVLLVACPAKGLVVAGRAILVALDFAERESFFVQRFFHKKNSSLQAFYGRLKIFSWNGA